MAERLTQPNYTYHDCEFMDSGMSEYMNRLAAYEDLGTVEELAALADAQRWIPVTERLPYCDEPVLVAYVGYSDGRLRADGVAIWSVAANGYNGGWVWAEDSEEVVVTITHWRPLLEPPKEESK